MSFADFYFSRYKYYPAQIAKNPNKNLKIIVIIPCFNEPEIINTLESILNNYKVNFFIEIIILINSSETTSKSIIEFNRLTFTNVQKWINSNNSEKKKFFVLNIENLPKKTAGAGLSRKIAMDEALRRFNLINNNNGFIISLDADTICDNNYFIEIEKNIISKPKTKGFTIHFEHPISGKEFSDEIYNAITLYEIYLRYYIEVLRFCNFPYSFHTIGSAFGVRADIYAKQGGMNSKQAGEDFYFLHKIIPLGNFIEINSTKVIPSPRISDRVPFGTGVVIEKIIKESKNNFLTYNFDAFEIVKEFLEVKNQFYKNNFDDFDNYSFLMKSFLIKNNFTKELKKINVNSPNIKIYNKRFFDWFDAFRVLKFLNFAHENTFQKKSVISETQKLLFRKKIEVEIKNPKKILELLRKIQSQNTYKTLEIKY